MCSYLQLIHFILSHGQKLFAPPDDVMNLRRLRQVLRRLWFFHFHVNIKYRLNREVEEKGTVARDRFPRYSPARAPAGETLVNGQRSAGSGAPADNPGQQSISPF